MPCSYKIEILFFKNIEGTISKKQSKVIKVNNMSYRVNRNYSQTKPQTKYTPEVKKFCGVCQKAGLSEKEYTSHFTKSTPGPQGIVTCPTILNNECSFCHNLGHFKNSCPAIAERDLMRKGIEREESRSKIQQQPRKMTPAVSVQDKHGSFSALRDSDSDSGDEFVVSGKRKFSQASKAKKEEWPTLHYKSIHKQDISDKPTFASVISSAAPKKVESQSESTGFTVLSRPPPDTRSEKQKRRFITDWTEESSDDESDCEA